MPDHPTPPESQPEPEPPAKSLAAVAPEPPATTLAQALARARRDCPATVFKGGRNKDQNYSYVGHEQVLGTARAPLLKHDLVLEQQSVSYAGELSYSTRNGPRPVWRWTGMFVLIHAPSAQERLYSFEATTQANDKAAYVASTALDRVALLRVLGLAGSDVENPEHDSHDEFAKQNQPAPGAGRTLPAPGGAPPPMTAQNHNGQRPGTHPEQADLEHAAKQATYKRYTRQLGPCKTDAQLTTWLVEVLADRLADDLKQALWIAFAHHANSFGFNPQVLKTTAQKKLRGAT